MKMIGHCRCGNTEVVWHWEHPEAIHPVICDCHYCTAHQARYVFRAGTAAEIRKQCFPGQPFGTPVQLHSGNRPRAERLRQWQHHWCAPVTIHTQTPQNSPAQESP